MNLAFPLLALLLYLLLILTGLYLAFTLVRAVVRISYALESASRSMEAITTKYSAETKPLQQ